MFSGPPARKRHTPPSAYAGHCRKGSEMNDLPLSKEVILRMEDKK